MNDPLNDLFNNYRPSLSSTADFMEGLNRRLDAVRLVKEHNAAYRRRCHRAVVIAAIAGIATGIIMSALLPGIGKIFADMAEATTTHVMFESALPWLVLAGMSTTAAYAAYDLTLAITGRIRKNNA